MKIVLTALLTSLVLAGSAFAVSPDEIALDLLANFNAGRFEAASRQFNPALRANVTPEVLRGLKRRADAEFGAFQKIVAIKNLVARGSGLPIVDIAARYNRELVLLHVEFDANLEVATLSLAPIRGNADAAMERTAREFFAAFLDGRYDDAMKHFDRTMRTELPAARLAELKSEVTAAYGAFRSVGEAHYSSEGKFEVVELSAEYERGAVTVRVVFDKDRNIAGVKISPAEKLGLVRGTGFEPVTSSL